MTARPTPLQGADAVPIGIDPTVDFAFKRVLGNPDHADITVHFLNAIMGGTPRITPKYRRPENNEAIEGAVEKWAYFLRFAALSTSEELTARLSDREFAAAAGVLEMIAKTPEERYWYELSLKSVRDEVSRMKGAKEEGLAEGIEKGREEGRQEGIEEGQKSGALMGQIQVLQSLIGEAVSSRERLNQLSMEELEQLIDEGQAKLRRRGLPPEA